MFNKHSVLAGVMTWMMASALVFAAEPEKEEPTLLKVVEQVITVNGKNKKVFNILQPDGTQGFNGVKGEYFNVNLKNETSVPISIHWHGLIVPNDQDGVPYVTQLPIQPGKSHKYHFKLLQDGTYWMHSHFRWHEQDFMSAPLIIRNPDEKAKDEKDVVVMLQDFTFKHPEDILKQLKQPKNEKMPPMPASSPMKPDLADVQYDAYLANRRTLSNPLIEAVKPGQRVRLRMINASSASNYWIDTGKLEGTIIASDGAATEPFKHHQFQIAVAQRLDIEVVIPKEGGAFPILAKAVGTKQQTGIILATSKTKIPNLSEKTQIEAPGLNNDQEMQLHAVHPLAKKDVSLTLNYELGGDMQQYIWTINNEVWPIVKPLLMKEGDRVEMVFKNKTGMAHPMHLHGHVFQVTEINGQKLKNGPLRDTINVLPHQVVKIQFDATNPGIWMLHCHVLYHLLSGMMTTVNYKGYPEPSYYKALLQGKIKE